MSNSLLMPVAFPCAIFLVLSLSIAGCIHTIWLWSKFSLALATPIDFGKTFAGKRIFGNNKMWRGLVAMPIASSLIFVAISAMRNKLPMWLQDGLWDLPSYAYAILGFSCGFTFMLAELPNSFFKRRLNVAEGTAPKNKLLASFCFLLDRFDSTLGALLALQLQVPISWQIWVYTLGIGGVMHWIFSYILYLLKVKARPL